MTHSILNRIFVSPTPTTTRDLLLSYLHKMPLEFLAFLNQHLDDGLTLVQLISSVKMVLNLNAIIMYKDSLINKKDSLLSPSKIKQFQRTELSMLEFLQEINSMTLNAKNNISINDIQTMILSLTLLAVSTSTDQALDRYWTEHYRELSNRLWLPTKIASAASGSISSTTYSLKNATSNSWFSITKSLPHKKNWSQTYFPSSPYLAPEPMDSENTNLKSNKISIYPTHQQRNLLKNWFGLSRWFYNRSIEACELFKCYDPVKIKAIVNGATPIPNNTCLYINEDILLQYGEKLQQYESENKPINTLQDHSLCGIPCHGEYCSKHSPASSQCTIINTIPHKNIEKIKIVPCLKPCEGDCCSQHTPRLKCRVKQEDGLLCQEYCKLDSTVCYRHQDNKRKDQYENVIPPWFVDLKDPYVPRFITGSIVDCCKSYKSSFALFHAGHVDKFSISQRTKKDRYQSLVIEKTCFSSDNIFLPKYFKFDSLKFGVFHTKHHKKFKFKQLQIKYDGRLIWDSKLDKWYYIYTTENNKKTNVQRIENQDALPKPSLVNRQIAIDLGIKTPGTGYSPNGHILTLDIHQPTSDILAQIEKLTNLEKLTKNQKKTLRRLQCRYKYRNDIGGELYGYLLAQDRLRCKIDKESTSKRKKKMYWKVFYRLSRILKNKINDFHWRCIKYLTDNYDCISVGNLKVKQIIKCLTNSNQRKTVRILSVLRMSKFMDRLKEKCKYHNKVLHIQNEACTSKTCSGCGWYNETLGRSRTFICLECNLVIDRDVNAARNIYLRSWLENGLYFRFPMHASAPD